MSKGRKHKKRSKKRKRRTKDSREPKRRKLPLAETSSVAPTFGPSAELFVHGPTPMPSGEEMDEQERREYDKRINKLVNKKHRKEQIVRQDELLGKVEIKDKKKERNKIQNQNRNQANNEKGDFDTITEYDSGDSLQSIINRNEYRRNLKEKERDQQRLEKLKEHQKNEDAQIEFYKKMAREAGYAV
eukprot:TRINITY_DN1515_c0_g1_i8.p1 TRINITY_DN1515_c0_g1~~TRINITY_DN1515_c0_g1_i8.p1  ORF type:complete len:187 (+),score=55.01 TRINITY_DN1515_c0_g1_i8:44-604(+)